MRDDEAVDLDGDVIAGPDDTGIWLNGQPVTLPEAATLPKFVDYPSSPITVGRVCGGCNGRRMTSTGWCGKCQKTGWLASEYPASIPAPMPPPVSPLYIAVCDYCSRTATGCTRTADWWWCGKCGGPAESEPGDGLAPSSGDLYLFALCVFLTAAIIVGVFMFGRTG